MSKPLLNSLKAAFSATLLAGAVLPSQAAAQDNVPATQPNTTGADGGDVNNGAGPRSLDRRGQDQQTDDFFAQKFKVYATKESIFIGQPQRYNFPLINLPEDGAVTVTRQYIDFRPLKKEWYGRATGVGYGIDLDIGNGIEIGQAEWFVRSGFYIGNFESPVRDKRGERHTQGEHRDNNVLSANLEASRDVSIGQTPANLIVGVSFNRVTGPDVDRPGSDTQIYQQLDFPALFNAGTAGDQSGLGRISGSVRTYAGTRSQGAEIGIYVNDFSNDGRGVNYSIGPEIRYDTDRGASVGIRFKIAPKNLF